MSETNVKNDSTNVSHEQPSGNEGLEKTSGTTSTSTGNVERIGVAPAMPHTGNIHRPPTDQHQ